MFDASLLQSSSWAMWVALRSSPFHFAPFQRIRQLKLAAADEIAAAMPSAESQVLACGKIDGVASYSGGPVEIEITYDKEVVANVIGDEKAVRLSYRERAEPAISVHSAAARDLVFSNLTSNGWGYVRE